MPRLSMMLAHEKRPGNFSTLALLPPSLYSSTFMLASRPWESADPPRHDIGQSGKQCRADGRQHARCVEQADHKIVVKDRIATQRGLREQSHQAASSLI